MTKKRGAIIPNPVDPVGTRRVVVCVPDTVEWLSLFTGCVAQMTFGWYWDRTTGDLDAVRDRAKQMYFEMQEQNGLCDVIDCDEVADCIENSDAVKGALSAYINSNYNPAIAGSGEMSDADKASNLLGQAGCDNDTAWGNALNIVQMLNRRNVDFLETLEAITNNQEAIDYIIDAIPVLETLPIDDFVIIADHVREWLADAYLAGYDVDYELERACEIFCLITNSPTCELTYAQLRDFYWDKARAIANFSDAFQSAVEIIEAWANWEETFGVIVCDVMCAMQFGFMNFLNSAFGYTFKQFKVAASAGIPDDDWTTSCDACPDYEWLYYDPNPIATDLTLDTDGGTFTGGDNRKINAPQQANIAFSPNRRVHEVIVTMAFAVETGNKVTIAGVEHDLVRGAHVGGSTYYYTCTVPDTNTSALAFQFVANSETGGVFVVVSMFAVQVREL